MMSTITTYGGALQIRCSSPELADHCWQQRAELTRLAGAQRLELLVVLDGDQISLEWSPPPLPATFTPSPRRRRTR